jgi:hypothetical protein
VITNCNFIVEKMRPLSLGITGEASEVERFAGGTAIVGTPQARSGTMTYNKIAVSEVIIDFIGISTEPVSSISIELQNEINWTPYTTVNEAIVAEDADSSMYPEKFTVGKRTLAGTVSQYLSDINSPDLLEWSTNSGITIRVGQYVDPTFYGFTLSMDNCSLTNRLGTGELFTQSYDWRLTQNPASLGSIVTYSTS